MNEQKIVSNGEFTVDEIYKHLEKCFLHYDLKIIDKNTFSENGNAGDIEHLMAMIVILKRCAWFMNYIKEWKWIDEDENYTENLLN